MSYDILIAFEDDYDEKSDETEVAKRVARELDLGDPVEQNRHFEREALNYMPRLEWRVDNLDQDASELFEEVFGQLMHLRHSGSGAPTMYRFSIGAPRTGLCASRNVSGAANTLDSSRCRFD